MSLLQADAARLTKRINQLRHRIDEIRDIWKDRVADQFFANDIAELLEAAEVAVHAIQDCDGRLHRIRQRLQQLRDTL